MTPWTSALAATALILASLPAEARIKCNGSYQTVGGNEIATPYCQDNYLAKVARQYGMRVSDAAVRNNPNLKREVCRLVGYDIRVSDVCSDEIYQNKGN